MSEFDSIVTPDHIAESAAHSLSYQLVKLIIRNPRLFWYELLQ